MSIFKAEGWKDQAVSIFQDKCQGDPDLGNPVRRLVLFKNAIKEVSARFLNAESTAPTSSICEEEDELGYCVACLRALEKRNVNRARVNTQKK